MAAGLGFKTFTTGEVLTAADTNGYLMQGVLVFASAAARDAAITSPQEGQCCYLKDTDAVLTYSGAAWVGFDDSNAIQNSIVDAKGDLVAASGADTPARLAVGSNGETLVADSATSTGLRYTENYAAGKNAIINGDFGINQRNFTSITADLFGFDRWQMAVSGATATYTPQTFTPGAAPVAGYEASNFARIAVTTGNDQCRIQQNIEDVRTFAGQTATVSFWAKGTNPTTAGNLTVALFQNFGSGGSPSATALGTQQTFVLTAGWTRYSLTFSVPSLTGKTLGTTPNTSFLGVWIGQGTSISTDAWTLDIWGVQAEAGSVATAFQTATGTIQGELAACCRYFCKSYDLANAPGSSTTTGLTYSAFNAGAATTGALSTMVYFTTPMRTSPTITTYDIALTSGKITRTTYGGADQNNQTPTASFTNEKSVSIISASGNSHTGLVFQWTASAEL